MVKKESLKREGKEGREGRDFEKVWQIYGNIYGETGRQ
jgi:hypothetical protein